jgi:hypothetical protein
MMLRGRLVVHGADVEKFARSAIRDSGLRLSWDRYEELLAELIAVAWELSERHDEDKYPGRFAGACYRRLRLRIVDHVRGTEGRTRWQFSEEGAKQSKRRHTRKLEQNGKRSVVVEHERRTVFNLDAPLGSDNGASLGETLPAREVDGSGNSVADVIGALDS